MALSTGQLLTIGSSVLQTLSILVAVAVGMGTLRSRRNDEVIQMANIRKDIEYIRLSMDKLEDHRECAQRAEQSAQAAHKRIDDHLRQDHQKSLPAGK